MTHPLETENEDLKKRIEDTYSEIARVDNEICRYGIYEMVIQVTSNSVLVNRKIIQDAITWGNTK